MPRTDEDHWHDLLLRGVLAVLVIGPLLAVLEGLFKLKGAKTSLLELLRLTAGWMGL